MKVVKSATKEQIEGATKAAAEAAKNIFMADDGTICRTREEMLRINKDVERMPEKIRQKFGQFQTIEKIEWFNVNFLKKKSFYEMVRKFGAEKSG